MEDLLRVQEHDTAGDQLRHRKANLPERVERSRLESQIAGVERRLGETEGRRSAVAQRQALHEAELDTLDSRIADLERRLYSGEVTASRELQAMLAEVEHLKARRSAVEDEVLMAMEEGEPLAAEWEDLAGERASLDSERERLRAALAEAERELDVEIAAEQSARTDVARRLPPRLLETYEGLRAKHGGVGAARLVGNSCSGCHLTLPLSEVDRIRREPADALVFCDQCGRILVP
jgi:predicted  nucleic acid-binding Zn-ribbon protein